MSPLVDQEWIDLEQSSATSSLSDEYEMNLLIDVVKRSLDVLRHRSIMIFAESKRTVDRVCEVLQKADIKNLPYYQDTGM